jgi:2',3'-cyclic-nucleotide 2'-phosphodiesterase (5'-nucleotidase family)
MSDIVPLRVVATHDFCCSYVPSPTSYGSLPGGEGLRRTVDRLREEGPTIRADAGDFAAPGALAMLSSGVAGFVAAADLDIDVGVAGNHELEWGIGFARARDRFPAPVCQLSRIWPSPEGGSRDGRWFRWLRRPDLP